MGEGVLGSSCASTQACLDSLKSGGGGAWLFMCIYTGLSLVIYEYFTGKLREFYSTKGSQDQFCRKNIQSAAKDVL